MAGTNDNSSTMTFAFDNPVREVGGFINWASPSYGNASIAVYDSSFNLIEGSAVTFLTGGGNNTGQFMGFAENSAIIKYFTLTGGYIGVMDLQATDGVTVPDGGSTVMLLGSALLGLRLLRRKSRG